MLMDQSTLLAIEILRLFRIQYERQPSRRIYDVLFKQAWKSRLYNCCKVLWIYSCVEGHTSWDMQQMVMNSLCAERSELLQTQLRSFFWDETAGKVITSRSGRTNPQDFERLVSMWQPVDKNRQEKDEFLRTMRSIMDEDLAAVGKFRIAKPLDELLSEALLADRQWAIGHALKKVPLACKYSQVVDVELIPQTSSEATDDKDQQTQPLVDREEELVTESPHIGASDNCWMSPAMRSRPCTCPAFVKEGLPRAQAPAEEVEDQGQDANPEARLLSPT